MTDVHEALKCSQEEADEEFERILFKHWLENIQLGPDWGAVGIEELLDDIRGDYNQWCLDQMEHDPTVGIENQYKLEI